MERNEKLVYMDHSEEKSSEKNAKTSAATQSARRSATKQNNSITLRIIKKLCSVEGFDDDGQIKGRNNQYINSPLMTHIKHVLSKKKKAIPHEREFLLLCREAGIDSSLFKNPFSGAKLDALTNSQNTPQPDTNKDVPQDSLVPFETAENVSQSSFHPSEAFSDQQIPMDVSETNEKKSRKRKRVILRLEKPKKMKLGSSDYSTFHENNMPQAKSLKRKQVIIRMEKPKRARLDSGASNLNVAKKKTGEIGRSIHNKRRKKALKEASASTTNFTVHSLPNPSWYVPK